MKVLHMISGGDSGGAKTHVFALLDALKKYCDVKIICLTPGVFYQEILKKDIDTVLVEQKNRGDLSIIKRIEEIIVNEKFEILHIHGARANFVATLLKGRIKIPVVTTVHSDYKLDFTEGIYKKYVFTLINKLALRMMDYYIGVSLDFKKMLIERGFSPNKIYTVYNGMDYNKERIYVSKEEFAEKYNIDYNKDNIYVGIIGRFDRVKGHEIFIKGAAEALKKNNKLRFLLAGEGELLEELQMLCADLGISDKIQFLGFIKDIYSFINFVDINTLTSLSESFPYVLLEGASMKKPTISSDVGGISDLISDGENGFLFESGNFFDFAQKLLILSKDEKLRESMGKALYETATGKFSGENLAKMHIDIYKSVLEDYKDNKKYDIVMSGYYGFNNSGDDALLSAIIKNLNAYKKNIRILVLSKKPKMTKRVFAVDSVNRFNPFSINRVFNKSRLFLSGGGTLIHDSTSSQSLYYYLALINWAKRKKMKTVIYANGYGPFKKKNEKIARKTTDKVDLITLRDDMSYEELRRIGVTNSNVYVTADPAVTLKIPSKSKTEKLLAENRLDITKDYFIVSVRDWQRNEAQFAEKMAEICDFACERYNLIPLFVVMRPDEDLELSEKIRNMMKNKGRILRKLHTAEDIMAITSKCKMVIGMRLHSLIYATTVLVPAVGIIYDPKVEGFLKYINQNNMLHVTDIDVDYAKELIKKIMDNADNNPELEKNVLELKKKAMENASLTIKLLEEK